MNDHKSNWLAEQARRVLNENGFESRFPPDALDQLNEIKSSPADIDRVGARDLTSLLWSSVDNRTSRDLDQVEWAERLPNGDIRVLVSIADVDLLIKKGTPLDDYARTNTVTVYTEGKNFPMLPEEISTGLTSLNEGEDRLAIVADMTVKENGDVPESTFFRAVVHNHAKLDYISVGEWLEGSAEPDKVREVDGLREQIELQREAAQRLASYRQKKGALEFESIESAAIVEDGEVKGLISVKPNAARRLIENFMVAANVEMAEFLEANGCASLRRVVKMPERWDGIRRIAAEHNTQLPAEPDQIALAAFLDKQRAADPSHFPDLSLSIIKLIGSGEYVVERPGEDTGGHFGLAVQDYAHSTAPNRRFSDLVVQRLVKSVIAGEAPPYTIEELEDIARQCNDQERAARKVERKMRKVVAASVMKRHVGESFDAIVTGVTQAGTFARILRPPVDGRIEQGQHGLDVGEKVRVRVLSADPERGFIDFAAHR